MVPEPKSLRTQDTPLFIPGAVDVHATKYGKTHENPKDPVTETSLRSQSSANYMLFYDEPINKNREILLPLWCYMGLVLSSPKPPKTEDLRRPTLVNSGCFVVVCLKLRHFQKIKSKAAKIQTVATRHQVNYESIKYSTCLTTKTRHNTPHMHEIPKGEKTHG